MVSPGSLLCPFTTAVETDICLYISTDTKDYVWSTWNEGQLRHYLEEKGIVDTPAQAQKNDLVAAVKKTYQDTADNVYDTWSDSYLVCYPLLMGTQPGQNSHFPWSHFRNDG